ncbi:MAG: hypothetical protein KC503_07215 [Myxococcales bacterium]|nr:hypothetical protein [Myxococcales bacterium]
MSVVDALLRHDVLLCLGCGGSGKTTTAAALALAAARAGGRAVVLTIDPARRLADALGVDALADTPRAIALEGGATFDAMVLDPALGWDRLVARYASDEALRARVLANRFYQRMSRGFAGSHELLAVEQLGALLETRRYDLVVVDTPPAAHALDFVDAPRHVLELLQRRLLRWAFLPYRAGAAASARWRGLRPLLGRLEQAVGVTALGDVADFLAAMALLARPLRARADAVYKLLRRDRCARLLVCEASERGLQHAQRFTDELARARAAPTHVLLNRAAPALQRALLAAADIGAELAALPSDDDALGDTLRAEGLDPRVPARWLAGVYRHELATGIRELAATRRLSAAAPPAAQLALVTQLEQEPCSLPQLERFAHAITDVPR